MLILTRRVGEGVHIGEHVHVTILGIQGRQIRIGLTAPKGVPILRDEIYGRQLASAPAQTAPAAPTAAQLAATLSKDSP